MATTIVGLGQEDQAARKAVWKRCGSGNLGVTVQACMKLFVGGADRHQVTLLPNRLDDYVSDDNPVRVVHVSMDELDLGALGFAGMTPAAMNWPG